MDCHFQLVENVREVELASTQRTQKIILDDNFLTMRGSDENSKETIMFDILMYMFENYIHSEAEIFVDHEELTDELTRAGFHETGDLQGPQLA